MATAVAIVGASGSGKSTSLCENKTLGIKGLDPKKTYLVNVSRKPLPSKGWKSLYNEENKNYKEESDAIKIAEIITGVSTKLPHVKHIVIDDSQYIMAFEFMRRAKENGYGKFADIGVNIAKVLEAARNARPDLEVYFLWHPEVSGETYKMKTVGKMVDDYLTLEGLFSIVLYTKVSEDSKGNMKYTFVTNHDGEFPAKSPFEMFNEKYIPNDLGKVSELINEFYN